MEQAIIDDLKLATDHDELLILATFLFQAEAINSNNIISALSFTDDRGTLFDLTTVSVDQAIDTIVNQYIPSTAVGIKGAPIVEVYSPMDAIMNQPHRSIDYKDFDTKLKQYINDAKSQGAKDIIMVMLHDDESAQGDGYMLFV